MIVEIPLKPCGCGVLAGEVCDCLTFAAEADRLFAERPITLPTGHPAEPSTSHPTPLVLVPAGNGLLKRSETQP